MLSEKEAEFVRVAELVNVDSLIRKYGWKGNGQKPNYRKSILLAFIAKAAWNFPTAKALVEYLKASATLRRPCGWERAWDAPSGSIFSRAFGDFAEDGLPRRVHEGMVRGYSKREGEDDKIISHISYDSMAIEAREKAAKKGKREAKPKKKRGRRKKDGADEAKEAKRLELQDKRGLPKNLTDLPSWTLIFDQSLPCVCQRVALIHRNLEGVRNTASRLCYNKFRVLNLKNFKTD